MKIDAADLRVADVVRVGGGEREITKVDRDPDEPKRLRAWIRGQAWTPKTEVEEDAGPPPAHVWWEDEVLEIQRPGDLFAASPVEVVVFPKDPKAGFAMLRERLAAEGWVFHGPKSTTRRQSLVDPTDTVRLDFDGERFDVETRVSSSSVGRWDKHREVRWYLDVQPILTADFEAGVRKLLETAEFDAAKRVRVEARGAEGFASTTVAPPADAEPVIIRYSRDGGVLLCGATFPNKEAIKDLHTPYRFKPSRKLPAGCRWFAPKTRGTFQPRSRIDNLEIALRARGVPVKVEYIDPGELAAAGAEPGPATTTEARIEAIVTQTKLLTNRHPTYGELMQVMLIAEREGLGREMRAWLVRAGKIDDKDRAARILGRVRGQVALEREAWPPAPDRGSHYSEAEYHGVLDSLEFAPEIAATLELAKRWPTALVDVAGEGARQAYYRNLDLERDPQRTFDTNVHEQVVQVRRRRRSDLPTGPAHALADRKLIAERVAFHQQRLEISLDPKVYDPKSDPTWVGARLCTIASSVAQAVLEKLHGVPFPERDDAPALCRDETTIDHLVNKQADTKVHDAEREIDSALGFIGDANALLEILGTVGNEDRLTIKRFNLAYWRKYPRLSTYERDERRLRAQHTVRGSFQAVEQMGPAGILTTLFVRGPQKFGFSIRTTSGNEDEAMEQLREELRAVVAGRDLEKARDSMGEAQRMPRRAVPPLRSPAVLDRVRVLLASADRAESEGKTVFARALRGAATVVGSDQHRHVASIQSPADVEFFEVELAAAGSVDEARYRGPSLRRTALEALLHVTAATKRTESQHRQLARLLTKHKGDRLPLEPDDVAAANVLALPFADSTASTSGGPREVRAELRRARKLLKFGITDTPTLQAALREYVAACHPIESTKEATVKTKPAKTGDPEKRAAKLRAAADRIEATANAQLDVDRQTNTHRRAEIAGSIITRENRNLEIAHSLRRAADVSDPIAFTYVAKINSRADVELLEREFSRAGVRWMVQNGYSAPSTRDLTPRTEFLGSAEYDPPRVNRDALRAVLERAGSSQSTTVQRKHVAALIKSRQDLVVLNVADIDAIEVLLRASKTPSLIADGVSESMIYARRRQRLGIHDTASLRAALREYLEVCRSTVVKRTEDPIAKAKQELQFTKIPGFFPTPRSLVERLVELAEIGPGMRVLEPSAGSGSIAEVIRERHPDAKLEVLEFNHRLHDLLVLQGFTAVGWDFMGFDARDTYDRIVMNPPFEDRAEVRHIEKARRLLKPGGRLVAIASGSFPSRTDADTTSLRNRITASGGTIEPLPAGTFKDSGTNVATVLIVYDEPTVEQAMQASKRPAPKRPDWAYASLTDEDIAAAEALNAIKAKWKRFETARPPASKLWDSIPNTACFEPAAGDESLTVCVGGQAKPQSIGACPPLPDPPLGDRKLALCEVGEPVEWFGGSDYIPAVRAETANRLARRRAKQPASPPKPGELPTLGDFAGQAKLLDALVPSGIVYEAKNPTRPLEVAVGGPHRRSAGGSFYALSGTSMAERLGKDETLVATVKLDAPIEFGEFVAGLGARWLVYTGPLSFTTLQKLRGALDGVNKDGVSLDHFRSGRFAGETVYWVENPNGRVLTDPVTAEGEWPSPQATRGFADERLPKLEMRVPEDWSLDEVIVVAMLREDKPYWIAWQPSTGLFRTHAGKRWGEPKPAKLEDGGAIDVPTQLSRTLRRNLDDAPRGSTFRVAGAWLGHFYPSDLPKTVVFEPPTGGAIDIDALRVDYAESLRAQETNPTGKLGEDSVKQAKRRLAWANKWLKDQAKAAKPKKTREPKPKLEKPEKPKKVQAPTPRPEKPKQAKAPPGQPEAAIATVVGAEVPTTCTTCTHEAEPTKETETMKTNAHPETAASSRAPVEKQTSKKTTKKTGKKAAAKKAAKKAAARKAKAAEEPKRTKKASTKKAAKAKPSAGPTNGVEQPKRGPGRPRKTPATPPTAPAPTVAAPSNGADTDKRARRRLARNDLVRFRKRSRIAAALRISESTTFRVEHGLQIQGERYVMIRIGNSNAAIPIPEGQLVAIERAEEFPPELRACVAQLGRYKGKLRPQVRHFLRELQRRA